MSNRTNNSHVHYNKGIECFENNEMENALHEFNKAIEIEKKNPDYYYNRGSLKEEMKDFMGAINDYDKAIELNPNDADYFYNRAVVKREIKNFKEALEDNSRAINLRNDDPNLYFNSGVIKDELNDFQGALLDYCKAIDLDPNDPDYYYNRGIIYEKIKEYENALLDYNKVLKLDLNYKEAELRKNRIQIKYKVKIFEKIFNIFIVTLTSMLSWTLSKFKLNSFALALLRYNLIKSKKYDVCGSGISNACTSGSIYCSMAKIYYNQGKYELFKESLEKSNTVNKCPHNTSFGKVNFTFYKFLDKLIENKTCLSEIRKFLEKEKEYSGEDNIMVNKLMQKLDKNNIH
jgi:tetratricopeptide (TPR) repeat protein